MDTSKVTRVEVIDHRTLNGHLVEPIGRRLTIQDDGCKVELSLQDDDRTLKVFLSDGER